MQGATCITRFAGSLPNSLRMVAMASCHDTKLGAFLPGVHESDRPDFLVGQIDGGAIGDVYCQA